MMAGGSKAGAGVFITFEGVEGSGKSTVCQRVFHLICQAGHDCWHGKEPGGTAVGVEWRKQILNPCSDLVREAALFLFLADSAQNFAQNIAPRLDAGCVVVLDRHRDSTAAYQGGGRCLDKRLIEYSNDFATRQRRPDLTILLDIEVREGLIRSSKTEFGEKDRIESQSFECHKRIRQAFLEIAEAEPNRFVVLDASQPLDSVIQQAYAAVVELFQRITVSKKLMAADRAR